MSDPQRLSVGCEKCKGACCASFSIPSLGGTDDMSRWLAFHGTQRDGSLEFECRCSKLTGAGRCSIYESRPLVCVKYVAGGPQCLATLHRRRTPEQIREILQESDVL